MWVKETGNEEGTSPQIEFLDDLRFFSGEVIAVFTASIISFPDLLVRFRFQPVGQKKEAEKAVTA